jgi:hypothetical protein
VHHALVLFSIYGANPYLYLPPLTLSLTRLQVFTKKGDVFEPTKGQEKKTDAGKTSVNRRRGRGKRGDWSDEKHDDQRDLRGSVTLWKFEKELERSRLSSTFEQLKLHKLFGNALCDEMQPEKGLCTPLAMHQLQSPHLMSWLLSLGEERLKELLSRMYDLKKGDVVDRMVANVLQFQVKNTSQTDMR